MRASTATRRPAPRQSAPRPQRGRGADGRAPATYPPAPTAISPPTARSRTALHNRTLWLHGESSSYTHFLQKLGKVCEIKKGKGNSGSSKKQKVRGKSVFFCTLKY